MKNESGTEGETTHDGGVLDAAVVGEEMRGRVPEQTPPSEVAQRSALQGEIEDLHASEVE